MKYILFLLLPLQALAFDASCSVYFSPNGGAEAAIVDLIGSAKHSIRVLAYSFTSAPISDALIAAHGNGIDVQVVLDKSQPTAKGAMLHSVCDAGIPVWIDRKHKIAHNKVIVIDGEVFETGSFNYTASAQNGNGENALICQSAEGAAEYLKDFERHRAHSDQAP